MSLFTSDRERRLWLWTLAVMVAIYSTLALAGTLAGFLRERNLLEVLFVFGLLLMAGAVVGHSLYRRPGRGDIWVTLGVTASYLMVWFRIESPE
jgi:predicted tellurium resistance membrane protein TerC